MCSKEVKGVIFNKLFLLVASILIFYSINVYACQGEGSSCNPSFGPGFDCCSGSCVWGICVSSNPCTPDSSCASSTCIGSTCSDSCGNIYPGTKSCEKPCIPNSCVSLVKQCGTWPDGCGGTISCGGCPGVLFNCVDGLCEACKPNGFPCILGAGCCSGICKNNICVEYSYECPPPPCIVGEKRCSSSSAYQECVIGNHNCVGWSSIVDCDFGQICSNGQCINSCTPNCYNKECGSDGCGGICGTCSQDKICSNGKCINECNFCKPEGEPPCPWWSPAPTNEQEYMTGICGSGDPVYQEWCFWLFLHPEDVPACCCGSVCGNNVINSGESCELPNTNNNNYCAQSTEECLNNKLGIRDSFGNCDSLCGCNYDFFNYQCVKGSCGAQCSSNADCNDCNPSTEDICLDDCTCKYNQLSFCGNGIIDYGEECEFNYQCDSNSCELTFNDYCNNKKLVEYNSNKILDSTIVSNSCQNSCNECICSNCQPQCNEPPTNQYCVKGVCNAECDKNSDCDDNNPNTQDTCLSSCMCEHTPIIICGNGVINSGESCELPNTNNNNYCAQSIENCVGNKLQTRDAFGNCNSICGCVQDSFSTPQCVKGKCGAQCSSNADCNDQNPLTVDSCENCQCEHEFICDKPCVRDGIWGSSTSGNEYYCAGDRTYYRCEADGCGYEHINQCESAHCSASPFCNTKQPNSDLASCNIFGQNYLQDRCNADCQLEDDNCEDDFTGCTAESLCDELVPGTNSCDMQCKHKICLDGETKPCGQGNCAGVKTCYNNAWSECSTKNLDCGTCCICNSEGSENFAVQNDCSQYNLQALSTCVFSPDNNPFTLDTANGFISQCVSLFTCSIGSYDINHECSKELCNAECENNGDCEQTDCDDLDKCYDGIYKDYSDVDSFCDDCLCKEGICNQFVEKNTDKDQDNYNIECENDCDDNDKNIHPGAIEICNKKDDDCDNLIDENLPGIKKKISFHAKNMGKVNQLGNQTVFGYSKLYFDGWATKGIFKDGGKTSLELVSNDGKRTSFYLTSSTKKILENTCSTFKVETYGIATYWSKETGRIRIPITSIYTINRLTNKVDVYGEANGFKYNITNVDVKCIITG